MSQCLLFLIVFICFTNSAIAAETSPTDVSIIQLISCPEKYNDRVVRVKGYLHNKFEDCTLYLNKDDADSGRTMNALSIRLDKEVRFQPIGVTAKDVDCCSVLLEGTFSDKKIADFSPGSLFKVYRIFVTPVAYDGKRDLNPIHKALQVK